MLSNGADRALEDYQGTPLSNPPEVSAARGALGGRKRRVLYGVFVAALLCEGASQIIRRFDLAPQALATILTVLCSCLLFSVVYYVVRLSGTMRLIRWLIIISGAFVIVWGLLDIVLTLPWLSDTAVIERIRSAAQTIAAMATVGFITCVMLGFLLGLLNALDANYLLAQEQEGLVQEVAERSRAEEALRQSEFRQRLLYNSVHAGIVVQAADGAIIDANHVAAEVFDLAIDDMRGKTSPGLGWIMVDEQGQLIPENDRPSMRTVRTREPMRNIVLGVLPGAQGGIRWLLVNTEPLFEPFQTEVSEVLITFQDVTELKQAQERLHASESRFRTIFDASPTAIVEVDASLLKSRVQELRESGIEDLGLYLDQHPDELAGLSALVQILDFNAATVRSLGARNRDEIRRDLAAHFTPESYTAFKDLITTLSHNVSGAELEIPIADAAGQPMWLALSLAVQPGCESTFARVLVSFIDITARKKAEEERLRLERQIQQTQRLESLGVLAGGIAHDFNNILMAILGHADMAQDELAESSPVRESLSEIELAARRASELCRQMLAYSGRGRFVIETIDLRAIVEEMVHLLSTSISKKAVVSLNLEETPARIRGDATQIRQIIMNLVVNAAEALGEDSGSITVSIGEQSCSRGFLRSTISGDELDEGRYAFLEVADTGCGMTPDTVARIFEPFFTTKFTGRGLGMSAVLGIVRGHKGTLTVRSEAGKGSVFKVLFPSVDEEVVAVNREPKKVKDTWQGSGCVLIVDDERPVRALGKRMLKRLGFEALLAVDGREAIQMYLERQAEIKCVILDLTMPNMNGEEALDELRRINPEVRVILSSGYTEHEIASRFEGKGLAGFVQKPYTLDVLRDCLRALTDGGSAEKRIHVFEE